MSEHYKEGLTQDEYEEKYNAAEALVFGEKVKGKVYAVLPSLEGIVEVGYSSDVHAAKEDYLEKLELLILELQEKHHKILYDEITLDYTEIGG